MTAFASFKPSALALVLCLACSAPLVSSFSVTLSAAKVPQNGRAALATRLGTRSVMPTSTGRVLWPTEIQATTATPSSPRSNGKRDRFRGLATILPNLPCFKARIRRAMAAFVVAAAIWIQGIPSLSGNFAGMEAGCDARVAHAAQPPVSVQFRRAQVIARAMPRTLDFKSLESDHSGLLLPVSFASPVRTSPRQSSINAVGTTGGSSAIAAIAGGKLMAAGALLAVVVPSAAGVLVAGRKQTVQVRQEMESFFTKQKKLMGVVNELSQETETALLQRELAKKTDDVKAFLARQMELLGQVNALSGRNQDLMDDDCAVDDLDCFFEQQQELVGTLNELSQEMETAMQQRNLAKQPQDAEASLARQSELIEQVNSITQTIVTAPAADGATAATAMMDQSVTAPAIVTAPAADGATAATAMTDQSVLPSQIFFLTACVATVAMIASQAQVQF